MTRTGRGIVYAATGEEARNEAARSLASVRRCSPGLQVAVFVDDEGVGGPLWSGADHCTVIPDPHFSWRDKIGPLLDRPFAHSLFLDADTLVRRPLEPLFELSVAHDVAAAHDNWRAGVVVPVPEAFVELNTGVLLLGDRPEVDELIVTWEQCYDDLLAELDDVLTRTAQHPLYRVPGCAPPALHDQPPFRWALWEALSAGRLTFCALPNEANLRLWSPNTLAAGAMPWIVHTHALDAEATAIELERSLVPRAWLPNLAGGMTGRIRDELTIGGTFGPAARRLSRVADITRNTTRQAGRLIRPGRP